MSIEQLSINQELQTKFANLPVPLQREAIDYIEFLCEKYRAKTSLEPAQLSEAALSDWNQPDEDEAWKAFQ